MTKLIADDVAFRPGPLNERKNGFSFSVFLFQLLIGAIHNKDEGIIETLSAKQHASNIYIKTS